MVAVTERATSAIVAATIAIGIVMVAIMVTVMVTASVIIRFAWAVVVTMSTMSETGVSA